MNDLLAQIEAILANPEATIEEMVAVLTAVQAELAGMVEAPSEEAPVDEAGLVAVADGLKKLEGVIATKKAATNSKNYVKELGMKLNQPTNQLKNVTTEVKSSVTKSKVYGNDEVARKVGLHVAAIFGSPLAAEMLRSDYGIKTLTSTNQASAGILVPDEMENEIVRLRESYGVARNFSTVKNMTSETLTFLKEVSGNTGYFIGNGTDITATDPVYRSLTLAAKNLAVRTKYLANLSEDAIINLADEITDWAARAIAVKEDQCFFIGDGSATYGGIVGITQVWNVQTTLAGGTWSTDTDADNNAGIQLATGTTWASVTDDDISKLMAKVADYPGADNVFHCTRQFYFNVLHPLAMAAGGVTGTEVVGGVPRNVFFGVPVIFNNVMAKVSAVGTVPLIYGDTKLGTYFGDRRGVTVETDKNIGTQEHDVVVTSRFDIIAHDFGNYNATESSQTPGAFAGLLIQNS